MNKIVILIKIVKNVYYFIRKSRHINFQVFVAENIFENIDLITAPVRFFFILLDRIFGVLRNVSLLIITRVALKLI